MLTLVNIYKVEIKKKDGTVSDWYDLLCSDDYVSRNHICGSASKTKVGQAVYNMFNERGYVSYIKFYDPDEKKKDSGSSADVPAAPSSDGTPEYPFT